MADVRTDWSVIVELAGIDESDRRRILRSHREAGFDFSQPRNVADRATRDRLDIALGEIGRLELLAETGGDKGYGTAIPGFAQLIAESASFHHYLDTYLYFKIRFAAGRLNLTPPSNRDCNETLPLLPPPPDLPNAGAESASFLALERSEEMKIALGFLDDYFEQPHEAGAFELWLRGLLPTPQNPTRFQTVARGLFAWAKQRADFYANLERRSQPARVEQLLEGEVREGDWHARNPLAARCGVIDYYWLARLLRAEVSPRGGVRYVDRSWLSYLPGLASRPEDAGTPPFDAREMRRIEAILRSAFDFAGELIENAIEIAEYGARKAADPEGFRARPAATCDWRSAYDCELDDIARQRELRTVRDPSPRNEAARETGAALKADRYWSKRILTGAHEENLFGIALSGGGIRSATFCLGILERLKDLDLLRKVDYLSTVSGGGYIGSWLTGNVRRTHYWLSPMTSWDESIAHLRRYSRYLAPRSGLLSADTWVMWGTWVRNAFLIQLTALTWMCALLLLFIAGKAIFDLAAGPMWDAGLVVIVILLAGSISFYLLGRRTGLILKGRQHLGMVLMAWFGSFIACALFWHGAAGMRSYSSIFKSAWAEWPWPIPAVLVIAMMIMALVSLQKDPNRFDFSPSLSSAGIGVLGLFVGYLGLCGVLYLFGAWAGVDEGRYGWHAYLLGPGMVMLAMSISVLIFIGLAGTGSADWRREWWTRFGSWLTMFGAAFVAAGCAAVFGPVLMGRLFRATDWPNVKWGALVTWIASTVASLVAGNSSKTRGNGESSSRVLEIVARVGAILFIVGAVLFSATLLRYLLFEIWLDPGDARKPWWIKLQLVQDQQWAISFSLLALVLCGLLFSWRFNLNIFGLNQFYRNRLVRCYLGATRWVPGWRKPRAFIGFDDADDLKLSDLRYETAYCQEKFRGPFPLINCSLNLGGSSDLQVHTRQSASFTLTPLHCGASRVNVGYSPVGLQSGLGEPVTLGQAVSISGAAASPNMGYSTSPLVSILLTIFNVRLGWWFPNPGASRNRLTGRDLPSFSLRYLLAEFFGLADEKSRFVNLSDGGHFENLGIYELIRRRAKVIIACDGECDSDLNFGSLGNVIRICDTDFGAKIDIDVHSIRKQSNGSSLSHCAVGRITYSNGSLGYLIYLKSSITGDEEVGIEQYRAAHPTFPHQSTADQFFTEDQFEAYRRLGYHIATQTFRGAESETNPVYIAERLFDGWAPSGVSTQSLVDHARALGSIWERFRQSRSLDLLLHELMANSPAPPFTGTLPPEELCACLELLQLMENVFLDLRLDDFWDHPNNRGWAMLFTMWAKSWRVRAAWAVGRRSFGIRFEYFCGERLGLPIDRPVVRV
ncbi:MAG TPA: hypothetical protein VKB79_12735 [Bryobacteraceae bacterium]|nr:hypothetical protein [Bryobacteraceae bacterium]